MKHIPFFLIVALLMIMPWFWIPPGYVYTSEEPNFINYDIKLDRASSMWSKDNGFGAAGDPSNQSLLIPNAVFYHALREYGFDRSNTQKIYISFTFLSIAIGFSLFSSLFTKNSFIKSIGLLLYLFNFYTVASVGYTAKIFQLVLMPPLFYLTYMYLKNRKIAYLLQNYTWLFVFQGIFTNLPLAVNSFSIYPLALLYYMFSEKKWDIKRTFLDFMIILLTTLPILIHHLIIYRTVLVAMHEKPNLFVFSAIGTTFDLLFQFRGAWWEKSGHQGIHYFNLWRFYGHPLTIITTVIAIGTTILSSVRISWKKNIKYQVKSIFWLTFYVFGLSLASGFYFFPGFYQWLMSKVPLMVMFREPWAKFIPYVVFSISAMTLVVLDFFRKFDFKRFIVVSIILVLHILVQSYPFVTREIIDKEAVGWKRRLVKIPDYWEEYSRWTKVNQHVILPIPFGASPFNSLYNWYPGEIGNTILPMPCALGKTNVICDNNIDRYASILSTFVSKKSFDFLKLGGVDMVLTQEDLELTAEKERFEWQNKSLSELIEPVPVATFGGVIRLYRLDSQFIRPIVYATQNIKIVERNIDIASLPINEFGERGIFIFFDSSIPEIKKTSLPNIILHKASQTKYNVKITEASEPFILVFNQTYNSNWQIQSSLYRKNPPHFEVNSFANGWYIDPTLTCKGTRCEINLTIEFKPQKYFSTSVFLSFGIFFIVSVSMAIFTIIKVLQRK